MTLDMTKQGILSFDGSCKTFDAAVDGYARSEAVNAIFIKRLDDAIRDRDPIRAVIRATASNSNGKTQSLMKPSSSGQEQVIRKAYEIAGIGDLSRTAYVECHGTGTVTGDDKEGNAVARVFGQHGVYIGSVKSNVGHTEGASGITGVIKAVLALEHRAIPPDLHFSQPNPAIPFDQAGLRVPVEETPWPPGRLPRVSVSSFGIGGSNTHVIIDSTDSFFRAGCNGLSKNCKKVARLMPVSAKSAKSLQGRIEAIKDYLKRQASPPIDQAAYTLGVRRDHLCHRAFCIANDNEVFDFETGPQVQAAPRVLFAFTGQGANWDAIAAQLMRQSPSFRQDIQDMDETLQSLDNAPSWTIEDILLGRQDADMLGQAEVDQPVSVAVQLAIVNFLGLLGVRPDAVVGHSSGEMAAAYAAGSLTQSETIICAYIRGKNVKTSDKGGAMAAVGLGRDGVASLLSKGVTIACENSDSSVTISGDKEAIHQTVAAIRAQDATVTTKILPIDVAYHTSHMCEQGQDIEARLQPLLSAKAPGISFFSTVTGRQLDSGTLLGPSYWRSNLESPVLFNTAMQALVHHFQDEAAVIVEIGPHSALQVLKCRS
ncbi:hypothetical protein CDD81_5633 [Ophiocordyceps australis]|uniref:Ketosynthase family 3 (KS3) domain-containing protein n=1 Tax=Ophiocordyceps australis TaxID=1399860 RepID=A0A2C5Y8S4_9HYPO|nr:hypothetical protein CDD81_5633 [Ophiocordyceps australis]